MVLQYSFLHRKGNFAIMKFLKKKSKIKFSLYWRYFSRRWLYLNHYVSYVNMYTIMALQLISNKRPMISGAPKILQRGGTTGGLGVSPPTADEFLRFSQKKHSY